MSNITPTNDNYHGNYYQKELSRLEEESKNDRKRTQAKNDDDIQRLEDRYKAALLKKDEESEKAIQSVRSTAQENLEKEKEKYQSSLDRLRDTTYNNRGISGAGHSRATGELESYYHDAADTLRDQLAHEKEAHRKQLDEETHRLDKSYQSDLANKNKELERAVASMRDTSRKTFEYEKGKYDSEIENLRNQNYTSKGLLANTIPYTTHKQELQDLQDEFARQRDDYVRSHNTQKLDDTYKADVIRKEKEADESLRFARESHSATLNQERKSHNAEVEKLKNDHRAFAASTSDNIPFSEYKHAVTNLQEISDQRHKLDVNSIAEDREHANEKVQEMSRKNIEQIDNLKTNHASDLKNLSNQIATLNKHNAEETKKTAEVQTNLVRDFENRHRAESRRENDTYQAVLGKLKQSANEHEAEVAGRTNQYLSEKDNHWSQVIAKQNQENYTTQRDLQNEFSSQVEDLYKGRKIDQEKAEKATESIVARNNAQREVAMRDQAKTFSETLVNERSHNAQEIGRLQAELQKQRTTQDTSLMSPAAEAALRKSLITDFEKTINSEVERNHASIDEMRQKHTETFKNLVQEYDDKEVKLNRQSAYEKELDRTRFFDTLADMEDLTKTKEMNSQKDSDRKQEVLIRNFTNLLERQRRDFEHSFSIARDDAAQKLSSFQRDSEVTQKLAQRNFTRQQNDTIREYESKLADLQAMFDSKVEDLKVQSQMDLRDAERRSNKELENQAKGYEQRIAQLEAQYKERERYVAQNYQDEIDRMKRAYEFGSKKKS